MVAPYYPADFVGPIPPTGGLAIPTTGAGWREFINEGYEQDSTRTYNAPGTTDVATKAQLPPDMESGKSNGLPLPLLIIGVVAFVFYMRVR